MPKKRLRGQQELWSQSEDDWRKHPQQAICRRWQVLHGSRGIGLIVRRVGAGQSYHSALLRTISGLRLLTGLNEVLLESRRVRLGRPRLWIPAQTQLACLHGRTRTRTQGGSAGGRLAKHCTKKQDRSRNKKGIRYERRLLEDARIRPPAEPRESKGESEKKLFVWGENKRFY